jgi:hypothetical protein
MAQPGRDRPKEDEEAQRSRQEAARVTAEHEEARERNKREVAKRNEKAHEEAKRRRRELDRFRASRRKGLEF